MLVEVDLTNLEKAILLLEKTVELIKKKDRITERINSSFTLINNFITTNKQIMGNLGLSKINLK